MRRLKGTTIVLFCSFLSEGSRNMAMLRTTKLSAEALHPRFVLEKGKMLIGFTNQ